MKNKILAIVNKKEITEFDVEMMLKTLPQQQAAQMNNPQGREYILTELINQNLYLADAIDTDLEKSQEFITEISRAKETILTQININKLLSEVKVSDAETEFYFNENRAKYDKQEETNTSHILVDDEKKCLDIYDKIISKEINFADAASKFSNCPSKENGGNLGSYPRGKMVPEYEAVAFSMKEGEISKPVKTQFGYHLIKLEKKTESQKVEYGDVKDSVQKELFTNKQKETYMNKINELKNKYKVEIIK